MTSYTSVGGTGTWRGTTAGQRTDTRRQRLLDATLAIFTSDGAAAVTVRAVTRESGLSPRFFYESFTDRDAALLAVWDQLYADAAAHVEQALATCTGGFYEHLRAGVAATAHWFEQDRGRAFTMLDETLADKLLREHARVRLPEFIWRTLTASVDPAAPDPAPDPEGPDPEALDPAGLAGLDPTQLQVSMVALTGAVLNLFLEWSSGELDVGTEALADTVVALTGHLFAVPPRTELDDGADNPHPC